MSPHGFWVHRIALVAATTGGFASLCVLIATYWATTGTTPAWIFSRFTTLRQLRSVVAIGGVPVEWIGLVWFGALAVALAVSRQSNGDRWAPWVFPSSVLLTGISASTCWGWRFGHWIWNLILLCALALLFTSASPGFEPRRMWAGRIHDLRKGWRPRKVFAAFGVLVLTGFGGVQLRAVLRQIPPLQAADANFQNWYSAQVRQTDSRLVHAGRVRVVGFCDYRCPACASLLPSIGSVIEKFDNASRPVELILHDFPLDAACNPGYRSSAHPGACEAAAAVRFIRSRMGEAAGSEAADWFYSHAGDMTPALMAEYLAARQLLDGYREARGEVLQFVSADAAYGLRLGVSSTPTFFINGVKLPAAGYLARAIRLELDQ